MSVYSDIVLWSETLPLWQRDALRRIAQTTLSAADVEVLAGMCIQEANGLPVVPAPVPLDAFHVPAAPSSGACVSLSCVSGNRSVNALVDDQTLTFGPVGITIVYGDNGAGKSGFARVLRHACQARGQEAHMLSDVYAPAEAVPSADVKYAVGGVPYQWKWRLGQNAPTDLARVAVFDSLAASELVETENAILWVPGGLDLLEHLARAVDAVRKRVDEAVARVAVRGHLPQVANGTVAHDFLQRLSADTPNSAIDALALSDGEQAEIVGIASALAAPDPAAASERLRQQARRFRALAARVASLEGALGSAGVGQLRLARDAYETAVEAESLLAQATFGDSVLPGVGAPAWQALWQAAENYARAGATSDLQFPSALEPAQCVLCQQPLSTLSRERLGRFHAFVRADTARRRANAADTLMQLLTRLRAIRASEAGDPGVLAELAQISADAAQKLGVWLGAAKAASAKVASLTVGVPTWSLADPLPQGWATWIEAQAQITDEQARALTLSADPAARPALILKSNELRARDSLLQARAPVEAEIERLRSHRQLTKATAACATSAITRKSGELTRLHVSDRLVASFAAEAAALRLPETVAYGPSRNEKGMTYQQMTLVAAPWATRIGRPARVLSEGERRAVAIAAFLAEVATRGDESAVVLDDPVSSLDHGRRHIVAERLIEVARGRQVVVFTHDLVFLHMLKGAADERGVAVTDREVRRAGASAGYCRDKAPAKATPVKALVVELKARAQQCASLHLAGDVDAYEQESAQGYGLLREAWERAVEELLFNQAVMRFGHTVQTNRLKKVNDITQLDLDTIESGMTICSKWLPGHAHATALNEPFPLPKDLLLEVERLEQFVGIMRKRGRS